MANPARASYVPLCSRRTRPRLACQVRGKLLGPKGSYLKHIQDQTGIRIQLAGKGSGNMTSEGVELDAPLQLVLTGMH